MSQQTERHYKLKHLLDSGRCLSKQHLLDELGTSPASLKRDLTFLGSVAIAACWHGEALAETLVRTPGCRTAQRRTVVGLRGSATAPS